MRTTLLTMKAIKNLKLLAAFITFLAVFTGCNNDDDMPADDDDGNNVQTTTITVSGTGLYLTNGEQIILRGINYPIIDEGLSTLGNPAQYKFKIDEAAKTGANAIRIQWYTYGTHWLDGAQYGEPGTIDGLLNDGTLSDIIGYCYEKGMIPILVIQNTVCKDDWDYFNNVAIPWWQQQVVLNLIEKHQEYLIANIACEFGYALWTDNTQAALEVFKTNYIKAVQNLRNSGIDIPFMIDAPDCGTSSSELLAVAGDILNADPKKNIIFSAHTYWSEYADTQAAITTKMDEIDNAGVCFIFGEVGNWGDSDECCTYDISDIYPIVLNESCNRGIGWLAWTYSQDCCATRRMTEDGVFNTLTPYGNDLVYSGDYGMINGGSCAAQSLPQED